MLLLTFDSGGALYAIDARQVVEVVPRVQLRPIPNGPALLTGMLWYRGRLVPVVDFAQLMRQGESRDALSTRVIVTTLGSAQGRDVTEDSGTPDLLGLIAENVNHVRRYQPNDVVLSAMNLAETPYLGGVVNTQEGLVQIIKPERLLPDRMHASFFQGMADSDSWT